MHSETTRSYTPLFICLLPGLTLLALMLASLNGEGLIYGLNALTNAQAHHTEALVRHYSWWPRLTMALLAGSGLAVAGVLMQQVLRNPLAAPTTLGVASGANLALMASTLMAPGLLLIGREWVALAGGVSTMALVFGLAWRRGLSPAIVVLAGLVVNLYAGALGMVLLLFHQETLMGLLIWGAGSLAQNGWHDVAFLWPRLLISGLAAWLLLRPLAVLELDDATAKSLGVSLKHLRLAGLGLAIFITACIVSVVGIIGFIGLAAPNIIRLSGVRRLGPRLFWSMLLGALLLATTDQLLLQLSSSLPSLIPTGAATALLGAPLLLWLIPKLRLETAPSDGANAPLAPRHPAPLKLASWLICALLLACVLALLVGQTSSGWFITFNEAVLTWRWPRLMAAAASGIMLAIAGTMIQRMTGNPMASPEVLGISGGCAIAFMAAIFLLPAPSHVTLVGVGTLGALISLTLLILINRHSGLTSVRLLLTGVALTSAFDAVRAIVLAGGDPRGQQVIAWLSGSTYYVDPLSALLVITLAFGLALASSPFSRWLDILPMGSSTARSLGIKIKQARLVLLLLIALLTACATLIVGPLSFIGLLAPHMARMAGFSRASSQLLGAALIGALLMVFSDWLGRQLLFPAEIPAGLIASLIGGSFFLWSLTQR